VTLPTTLITILSITSCCDSLSTVSLEVSLDFNSSVRAIHVIDADTIVFSGSGGLVGVTTNGGENWETTTVEIDGVNPSFRACAASDGFLHITSIESPALILKTSINHLSEFEVKFRDDNPTMFLDAMAFNNNGWGVVMGDPTDGCLTILISSDDGESWHRIPCNVIPEMKEGEAAFAASNGNISVFEDQIWIATGGKSSRVFHSEYLGNEWEVYDTPLTQGGTMTGAFAITFRSEHEGLIIGGDWENKANNTGNIAHTTDGGKSWTLCSEGEGPGYRSSIIWRPGYPTQCLAIGSEGISMSIDSGVTWNEISEHGFYTGRFTPDGNTLWLAGIGVISKMNF
jgi:photosystem II stability/assembly factor-like uncharacterized protein